ncbi:MAG TPA: hypothetical protein VGH43_01270 [Jatrophihabitans sp.]
MNRSTWNRSTLDLAPSARNSARHSHRGSPVHATSAPLAVAQDGGARLDRRGNVTPLGEVNAADFITSRQGWAVGTQMTFHHDRTHVTRTNVDRIIHTSDGGNGWHTQLQFPVPG